MKKLNFFAILLIFALNLIPWQPTKAASTIYDIKQSQLKNGYVTVSWLTEKDTTGYLVFGTSQDNMPFHVGSATPGRYHSADLTGLISGQAYYFKIYAQGINGGQSESFLGYVSPKYIKDETGTEISDMKKLQTTDKGIALSFTTSKGSKTEIRYGTSLDKLTKVWRNSSYRTDHFVIITGLQADTRYIFRVTATDKDGNRREQTEEYKTSSYPINEIKISNLTPESYGQAPLMPENAFISWETNVITTAEIKYGTSADKLNKTIKSSVVPALGHQLILTNLEPNTNYFYRINLKSPLLHKSYSSQIYSFKTAPLTSAYLNMQFKSGDLVKYKTTTYLLYNDQKVPLYSTEKTKTVASNTGARSIEKKYIDEYIESDPYWGIFHDGQVVKEAKKNTIYLIDGEYRRPIANWQVFSYLNYQADDIVIASKTQLSKYKLGAAINHSREITGSCPWNNILAKTKDDSAVYLIINGQKLPFLDEAAFKRQGYKFSDVQTINTATLNGLPVGQLII